MGHKQTQYYVSRLLQQASFLSPVYMVKSVHYKNLPIFKWQYGIGTQLKCSFLRLEPRTGGKEASTELKQEGLSN